MGSPGAFPPADKWGPAAPGIGRPAPPADVSAAPGTTQALGSRTAKHPYRKAESVAIYKRLAAAKALVLPPQVDREDPSLFAESGQPDVLEVLLGIHQPGTGGEPSPSATAPAQGACGFSCLMLTPLCSGSWGTIGMRCSCLGSHSLLWGLKRKEQEVKRLLPGAAVEGAQAEAQGAVADGKQGEAQGAGAAEAKPGDKESQPDDKPAGADPQDQWVYQDPQGVMQVRTYRAHRATSYPVLCVCKMKESLLCQSANS